MRLKPPASHLACLPGSANQSELRRRDLIRHLERELEFAGLERQSSLPNSSGSGKQLLGLLEPELAPFIADLDNDSSPIRIDLDTTDAHAARAGDHIAFVTHSEGSCIDDCQRAFSCTGNAFESQFDDS